MICIGKTKCTSEKGLFCAQQGCAQAMGPNDLNFIGMRLNWILPHLKPRYREDTCIKSSNCQSLNILYLNVWQTVDLWTNQITTKSNYCYAFFLPCYTDIKKNITTNTISNKPSNDKMNLVNNKEGHEPTVIQQFKHLSYAVRVTSLRHSGTQDYYLPINFDTLLIRYMCSVSMGSSKHK